MAFAMALSGCSALPGFFSTIFGGSTELSTRTPIYVYRADLILTIDGAWFDGVGVTILDGEKIITIDSQINLDRIEVETCARQEVCQNNKYCSSNFSVQNDWWGNPGRHATYTFTPSDVEKTESCPLHIKVYDKKVLAAWGFIAFRNGESLPGHFTCNGEGVTYAGHSVCQTKAGLIQRLTFLSPIEDFDADKECNLKKLDEKTFEIRPSLGLCTAKFYSEKKWHGLDIIGYDEVITR